MLIFPIKHSFCPLIETFLYFFAIFLYFYLEVMFLICKFAASEYKNGITTDYNLPKPNNNYRKTSIQYI